MLKRRGYLGRCRDHGEDGLEWWVGWGILSSNLGTIARSLAKTDPLFLIGAPGGAAGSSIHLSTFAPETS